MPVRHVRRVMSASRSLCAGWLRIDLPRAAHPGWRHTEFDERAAPSTSGRAAREGRFEPKARRSRQEAPRLIVLRPSYRLMINGRPRSTVAEVLSRINSHVCSNSSSSRRRNMTAASPPNGVVSRVLRASDGPLIPIHRSIIGHQRRVVRTARVFGHYGPTSRATAATSLSGSIGFATYHWNPAASALSRSSSLACAVTAIAGVLRSSESSARTSRSSA